MKRALFVLTMVLAISALGALAMAQQTGGQQQATQPKHQVPPLVAALDANGDGVIDAQEIANAPAELKTLDKNGDGKLTRDEFRPQPAAGATTGPKGGGGNQPGGSTTPRVHHELPILAALDANGDHVIDAQEIANAPAALKTLDKNGDGKLTRDEYMGSRPDGKGKGGRQAVQPTTGAKSS